MKGHRALIICLKRKPCVIDKLEYERTYFESLSVDVYTTKVSRNSLTTYINENLYILMSRDG